MLRFAQEVKNAVLFAEKCSADIVASDGGGGINYTFILNGEKIATFDVSIADHCEMKELLASLIDDDFYDSGDYDAEVERGVVSWRAGGLVEGCYFEPEDNRLEIVKEC